MKPGTGPASAAPSSNASKRNISIIVGITIGLGLWAFSSGGDDIAGDALSEPPAELIGIWDPDAPRYEGRFLEITPEGIALGRGEPGEAPYFLTRSIHRTQGDGYTAYVFEYEEPVEGVQLMEVRLYEDGALRLPNPDDVTWTRR